MSCEIVGAKIYSVRLILLQVAEKKRTFFAKMHNTILTIIFLRDTVNESLKRGATKMAALAANIAIVIISLVLTVRVIIMQKRVFAAK
jgi:hypothetical protein